MGQLTKQFGKIKVSIPIPHLLNLQVDSYKAFLQEGRKERLPDEGLEGVFRSVFPIEDFNRTASLEYLSYDISEPKYDQAECISKGLTYEAPIRLKVRLDIYDVDEATGNRTFRDGKEQDIYFGTLPLMTEKVRLSSMVPNVLLSTNCSVHPESFSSMTAARPTLPIKFSIPAVLSPCAAHGSISTSTTKIFFMSA